MAIAIGVAVSAVFLTACDLGVSERWPSYTIVFNANDGTDVTTTSMRRLGAQEDLSDIRFQRTGHTFMGWAKSPDVRYDYARLLIDRYSRSNLGSVEGSIVMLYAIWRPHRYTIFYDPNNGDDNMEKSLRRYGTPDYLRANTFTKTGHNFLGWARSQNAHYTEIEFCGKKSIPSLTPIDGDEITLFAIWGKHAFEVHYNPNGGYGSMSDSRHSRDVTQNLNANTFTRVGHTFAGWARSPGDNNAVEFVNQAPVRNLATIDGETITLFAIWRPNTYTIVYAPNGGTGEMANSIHRYGTPKYLNANTFTKVGHTFTGWARSSADGTVAEFTDEYSVLNLISTDGGLVTLYAIWRVNTYTVLYNANKGSEDMASSRHYYGTAQPLRANTFTRTGYAFLGWAVSADGSVEFTDEYPVLNLTLIDNDTITLYAVWGIVFTVTFNANGGAGTPPASQGVITGDHMTLPDGGGLERSGLTFGGWNKSHDGTGTTINSGGSFMPFGNVTLYARWIVAVTFNANGGTGTVPAIQEVTEGFDITIPESSGPFRVGFVFGGWNTKADGTGDNLVAGDILTPTESIPLYARWILTWTAAANSASNTTAINITFNAPVSGLTADDITVTDGTGTLTPGALTGSEASWSLAVVVTNPGNITVSINRDGIYSGPRTVAVRPISWIALANSATNTTVLNFTFGVPVSGLTMDDITVTDETGAGFRIRGAGRTTTVYRNGGTGRSATGGYVERYAHRCWQYNYGRSADGNGRKRGRCLDDYGYGG